MKISILLRWLAIGYIALIVLLYTIGMIIIMLISAFTFDWRMGMLFLSLMLSIAIIIIADYFSRW